MSFANIYQYLDVDGEAPSVSAKSSSATKENTKPATQSKIAPAKQTTQVTKNTQQSSSAKSSGPRDSRRGDRQEGRGGFRNQGDRPPRQQGEQRDRLGFGEAAEGTEAEPSEFVRRDRENNHRDGESRGDQRRRGVPAGGFVGNKRINDRKSGTGRPPREEKRGGRGRGNWGASDGTDEAPVEEGKEVTETTATTEVKPEEPEVESEEQRLRREEREKEAKQIGLDDYFKLRDEKRNQLNALAKEHKVRQANEGVDPAQAKKWGSFQALKRDEETPVAETQSEKSKKKSKNTVRVDEIFKIKEQPRQQYDDERRGGRGGRRDDRRGGERRSAPRGQSHTDKGVDFSDPSSFPTLQ